MASIVTKNCIHRPRRDPWHGLSDLVESYCGLELRSCRHPRRALHASYPDILTRFGALVRDCFPPADRKAAMDLEREIEETLESASILVVAVKGETLYGATTVRLFDRGDGLYPIIYVSGTFSKTSHRRIGLGSRMNYTVTKLCRLLHEGVSTEGLRLPFVARTQSLAVYRLTSKWCSGVAPVGVRPSPRQQALIDRVSRELDWKLDRDNVQRDAYTHRLSQRLIPGLGERDALVVAGEYRWRHLILSRALFDVGYPVKHGSRKLTSGRDIRRPS